MYASMPNPVISVMRSTQMWIFDWEKVIIPEKISMIPPQVPPNWQRQNARGTSALGHPEERLEKQDNIRT
ncbi:hypothetical protein E2C01_032119 [Portunus trituberculatus]|uniref:Uncharacterized protein n=1 Tax=Portunus trituberculatus TaxID=210409 RepID=A0A5B7EZH1_PORTR|nr:hypothetical protein [Portunus trituberculatus]